MLIKGIKRKLGSKKFTKELNLLRAICGTARFKIIFALRYADQGGLTVTEIARILNASLSRTSHQLRILKTYRLIEIKSKNRETVYRLFNHRLHKFLAWVGNSNLK